MARNRDGHADLDDIHDALGNLRGATSDLTITNELLKAIARKLGAQIPIAVAWVRCAAWREMKEAELSSGRTCYFGERVVLHEGEEWPEKCSKCGGPVKVE